MTDTQQANASAVTVSMGGVEHPITAIPATNQAVLLQRALNHIFSNEKSSFIKGRRDKAEKEAKDAGQPFDVDAWDKANEDALEDEFIQARTDVILNGVLGQRAAGVPKSSRLDRMIASMVRTAIENSQGVKSGAVQLPKRNAKGSGDWWDAMVAKVLADAGNKTRFTALAEAELKRQDEAAKALGEVSLV